MFPDHFGALTLPLIICKIQEFFSTVPNCEDIRFINDDLIGFFNSVPQGRILECICILLQSTVNFLHMNSSQFALLVDPRD